MVMLALRASQRGYFEQRYLVWNLFLAGVPFPFAWMVDSLSRRRAHSGWLLLPAAVWLAFFPNAPYLVTDLIHLRPTSDVPLWFDGLVFFAFASTGLLAGFVSLYLVEAAVSRRFGRAVGWGTSMVAIAASSYGIYLGRVERWNSWDVVTNPKRFASAIGGDLIDPLSNRQAIVISIGFAGFLTAVYGTLRVFAHMVSVDGQVQVEKPNGTSGLAPTSSD